MINIVNDLSNLTTIPEKTLAKLCSKMIFCISDAIVEAKTQGLSTVDLDIGIGTLSILLSEEEVKYKYIPSTEFEDAVKSSILEERNLLEDKLEQSFAEKITNLYKDLI